MSRSDLSFNGFSNKDRIAISDYGPSYDKKCERKELLVDRVDSSIRNNVINYTFLLEIYMKIPGRLLTFRTIPAQFAD